jgi:RNA polymerase sigma-70 factor (ECF subfamily)
MVSIKKTNQEVRLATAHDEFAKKLNAYAFFKTSDHEMGEDMVQTTFLKTWVYLVKGGKIEIMKAFLYHILNNLIVDEYRKHKNSSLDALEEKGFEPEDDSSKRLLNFLDGKAAVQLIQRLPEAYRKVIRMRYIQDLSLKEMSLLTGKTRNAMAVQVHRGLEKLKVLYAHSLIKE